MTRRNGKAKANNKLTTTDSDEGTSSNRQINILLNVEELAALIFEHLPGPPKRSSGSKLHQLKSSQMFISESIVEEPFMDLIENGHNIRATSEGANVRGHSLTTDDEHSMEPALKRRNNRTRSVGRVLHGHSPSNDDEPLINLMHSRRFTRESSKDHTVRNNAPLINLVSSRRITRATSKDHTVRDNLAVDKEEKRCTQWKKRSPSCSNYSFERFNYKN